MNEIEIGKVLATVSAVDSRNVTEPMIKMWTRVLNEETRKPWTYEEALDAVPAYFANESEYLSPRGLIVKMKQKREELAERQHSKQISDADWKKTPEPVCKEHEKRVTACLDCCSVLFFQVGHLSGDALHRWAVANLYKPESEWSHAND